MQCSQILRSSGGDILTTVNRNLFAMRGISMRTNFKLPNLANRSGKYTNFNVHCKKRIAIDWRSAMNLREKTNEVKKTESFKNWRSKLMDLMNHRLDSPVVDAVTDSGWERH